MKEKKVSEAINFRRAVRVYDSNKKRVYYLEGYVYAPGSKKRNLMQEISSILMTFEL